MEGRRDLAPLENEGAIRIEDELRVVERAMIPLVDAKRDDDAMFAGGCRHRVGRSTWNRNRFLVEPQMLAAGENRGQDEGKIGIPGDECLRENDQFGALAGGLADRFQHAGQRPVAGGEIRRDLCGGGPDGPAFLHDEFLELR